MPEEPRSQSGYIEVAQESASIPWLEGKGKRLCWSPGAKLANARIALELGSPAGAVHHLRHRGTGRNIHALPPSNSPDSSLQPRKCSSCTTEQGKREGNMEDLSQRGAGQRLALSLICSGRNCGGPADQGAAVPSGDMCRLNGKGLVFAWKGQVILGGLWV